MTPADFAQLELNKALASGDPTRISQARASLKTATLQTAIAASSAPVPGSKTRAESDHDEPDGDEEPGKDDKDDAEAECAECEGTGKAECESCEGTGKKGGDADAEAECAECEGTGYDSEAECAECEGSGKSPMDADDKEDDGDEDDDEHTDTKKSSKALVAELLKVTGQKSLQGALGAVRAFRDGARKVETLGKKVEKMERETRAAKVDKLISAAVREGKIAPAQKAMFRKMGMRNVQELRAYVESAPRIVSTRNSQEPSGQPIDQGSGPGSFTAREQHILRQMGVTEEQALAAQAKRNGFGKFPTQ